MKKVWLVWTNGEVQESVDFETDVNVLVSDIDFVLAFETEGKVKQLADELNKKSTAHWLIGKPKAGKWVSSNGDHVYVDNNGKMVETATEVLKSLGISFADDDADEILFADGLVF